MHEKFGFSGDTKIQYLSVNQMPGSDPVIFIPGAVVNAEEFYEPIKDIVNFHFIIISLRGLGKSSKPVNGYSMDHFVSDIDSVVQAEGLNEFWLAGHSVGAGIASAYAVKHPDKVKGLILADYPPGYPKFTPEWGKMVRENHPDTDDNFINGVITESEKHFFPDELATAKVRVLMIKGDGEDSLLTKDLAERVLSKISGASLKVISGCGHEMFNEKSEEVLSIIEEFLK